MKVKKVKKAKKLLCYSKDRYFVESQSIKLNVGISSSELNTLSKFNLKKRKSDEKNVIRILSFIEDKKVKRAQKLRLFFNNHHFFESQSVKLNVGMSFSESP